MEFAGFLISLAICGMSFYIGLAYGQYLEAKERAEEAKNECIAVLEKSLKTKKSN